MYQQLHKLIIPVIRSFDLELWGMEFMQGGRSVLRVYIDGPQGVTIDQCALVSRHIGLALEVEDPITGAYTLEVSSPGLERPLFTIEQMAAYKGHAVELVLRAPADAFPGRKKFTGIIESVDGDGFIISVDPLAGVRPATDVQLNARWAEVKKAKLVYRFDHEKGQKHPRSGRTD